MSAKTYTVAGPSELHLGPDAIYLPGEPVELTKETAAPLLADGVVIAGAARRRATSYTRQSGQIDPPRPRRQHQVRPRSGKPDVRALEKLLGFDHGDERNVAWDREPTVDALAGVLGFDISAAEAEAHGGDRGRRPTKARPMAGARPPDHLCGLGYSPSDARQSAAEGKVCHRAERLLNMVHAYCKIRDSWTGWLRRGAMGRTLYHRIVPEMRALRRAERRIVERPSVTLLAVLDYADRARAQVPRHTPLGIDHPQPPIAPEVRKASARMIVDADQAALAAKRAGAREYAARMADAIERERAEEARRQQAMRDHGVTETPDEAARATAAVEARIEVYARELRRVADDAGLAPAEAGGAQAEAGSAP